MGRLGEEGGGGEGGEGGEEGGRHGMEGGGDLDVLAEGFVTDVLLLASSVLSAAASLLFVAAGGHLCLPRPPMNNTFVSEPLRVTIR